MNYTKREREAADAADLHASKVRQMLNTRKGLAEAIGDYTDGRAGEMLAEIFEVARFDEAEAGRRVISLCADAAHASARATLGERAELVEPKRHPGNWLADRLNEAMGLKK